MHETQVIKLKQTAQAYADEQAAEEALSRAREIRRDVERMMQSGFQADRPTTVVIDDGRLCTVTRTGPYDFEYLLSEPTWPADR